MKIIPKTIVFAFSVLSLSGCATRADRVETKLVAFHRMQANSASEATITVLPWRKEWLDSLEFREYARQIESRLSERGYRIADQSAPATHALIVDYGIDDGKTISTPYSIPQWGVIGSSGSRTTGTITTYGNTSAINATTTAVPTYGVSGYRSGVSTELVFTRFVNVDIVKLSSARPTTNDKVYEGRLKSQGTCGNFVSIMPILLDSLFTDFPGPSGKPVNRDVPWNGKC